VKADFHTTQDAQAARTVVKERLARGKSVKLSIGYEVLLDEYVPEGRLLKDIKLYEWSIVTVPANPQAAVTGAKGLTIWKDRPLVDHASWLEGEVRAFMDRKSELEGRRDQQHRGLSEANKDSVLRVAVATHDVSAQAIAELLAEIKAGRVLSEAMWKRFSALADSLRSALADIDDVLAMTEPRPKAEAAEPEKAKPTPEQAKATYDKMQARLAVIQRSITNVEAY
jgi:hypothetical protein